jgi:hypothetical protein
MARSLLRGSALALVGQGSRGEIGLSGARATSRALQVAWKACRAGAQIGSEIVRESETQWGPINRRFSPACDHRPLPNRVALTQLRQRSAHFLCVIFLQGLKDTEALVQSVQATRSRSVQISSGHGGCARTPGPTEVCDEFGSLWRPHVSTKLAEVASGVTYNFERRAFHYKSNLALIGTRA